MRIINHIAIVRRVFYSQRGTTLIEVIVGLVILATAGIAFLSGLTTAWRATITNDIHETANQLAKSQMEFVKSMPYQDGPWSYQVGGESPYDPDWWVPPYSMPETPAEAADFTIIVSAINVENDYSQTPVELVPTANTGLIKIETEVFYPGYEEPVTHLEDLMVDD